MSNGIWNDLIQNYVAIVTASSGALAVLIFIYKKGVQPVLKAIKEYNSLIGKVDAIFEEIKPNGGKSIKDTVNKIDAKLTLVSERQRAMAADDTAARFETDPHGNCIWVNRTYTRLVQRNPSELMGKGWQNAIAQQDRDDVVNKWYKAAEDNIEFIMDFNFATPNGTLLPCKIRSYKMTDSGGNTIGFSGSIVQL